MTLSDRFCVVCPFDVAIDPTLIPNMDVRTTITNVLGAGNNLELKAGVTFGARVATGRLGLWGQLKDALGIDDTPMVISGCLNSPFIQNLANGTLNTTLSGVLQGITLKIVLPPMRPPSLPAEFTCATSTLTFTGAADGLNTGIAGGMSFVISGKTFNLDTSLTIKKPLTGSDLEISFSATPQGDRLWDRPLGISFISLKSISFSGSYAKEGDDRVFKCSLTSTTVFNGTTEFSAVSDLIVKNKKVDDIRFKLASTIPLSSIPGLSAIPFLSDLSVKQLWVSKSGVGGTLIWTRLSLEVGAMVYTSSGKVSLLLKIPQFNLKRVVPTLPVDLTLPTLAFVLSNGGLDAQVSNLPTSLQEFLADITTEGDYRLRLGNGVGLIASLDPASATGNIKTVLDKLGISEPVVLSGAITGIFGGGSIGFSLAAKLPRMAIPTEGLPQCLDWARGVSGEFFVDFSSSAEFTIGAGLTLGVRINQDEVDFKARISGAISTTGLGIGITGQMLGQVNDIFGLPGLNASDVTLGFTLDADGAVGFVAAGNCLFVDQSYTFKSFGKFLATAAGFPKEVGVEFTASRLYGLPILNFMKILDSLMMAFARSDKRREIIGRISNENLRNTLTRLCDEIAAGRASMFSSLKIDQLPIGFSFRDFKLKLVTPGASDATLNLSGPAAGLGGTMVFKERDIATLDSSFDLSGFKASGTFLIRNIGPLTIREGKIDILANFTELPHFYVHFFTELFGTSHEVLLSFSKDGLKIKYEDRLGVLFSYLFEAQSVGTDLLNTTDFTVHSLFKSDFNTWIKAEIKRCLLNWQSDPAFLKAKEGVTTAQNSVNSLQTQINAAVAQVQQERAAVRASVDAAWRAVSDLQNRINQKQAELNSAPWWAKIGISCEIGGLWIALQSAIAYARAVEGGLQIIPIELDPRVSSLILAKTIATAALNAANALLTELQGLANQLKTLGAAMIDASTGREVLVIRKAEFSGSLKQAIGGTLFALSMDMTIFGNQVNATYTLDLKRPDQLAATLVKPLLDKIVAAFSALSSAVSQAAQNLSLSSSSGAAAAVYTPGKGVRPSGSVASSSTPVSGGSTPSEPLLMRDGKRLMPPPPAILNLMQAQRFHGKDLIVINSLTKLPIGLSTQAGDSSLIMGTGDGMEMKWRMGWNRAGFVTFSSASGKKHLGGGPRGGKPFMGTGAGAGDAEENQWNLESSGPSFRFKNRKNSSFLGIPMGGRSKIHGRSHKGNQLEMQSPAGKPPVVSGKGLPCGLAFGAKNLETQSSGDALANLGAQEFEIFEADQILSGRLVPVEGKPRGKGPGKKGKTGGKTPGLENNSLWKFIPFFPGEHNVYFFLLHADSGKMLVPPLGENRNLSGGEVTLEVYDPSNPTFFVWRKVKTGKDTFALVNMGSNLVLALDEDNLVQIDQKGSLQSATSVHWTLR